MKRTAIIWREGVYKNGFKCGNCGTVLAAADGTPADDTFVDVDEGLLICPGCGLIVAVTKEVDLSEDIRGLQGDWEEFRRRRCS